MTAAVATAEAAPCVGCGTVGGYVQPGSARPIRRRGYCTKCHWRRVVPPPTRHPAAPRHDSRSCFAPRLEATLPVLNPRFGVGDLTPAAFSKLIRRGMHPGPAPGLARLLTAEAIGRWEPTS